MCVYMCVCVLSLIGWIPAVLIPDSPLAHIQSGAISANISSLLYFSYKLSLNVWIACNQGTYSVRI